MLPHILCYDPFVSFVSHNNDWEEEEEKKKKNDLSGIIR